MWSAVGRVFRDDCRTRAAPVCCNLGLGDFMTAPLDPVIAQIIPLLPLRDPETLTPQSARDSLRALAAARAAVPPPKVASAIDTRSERQQALHLLFGLKLTPALDDTESISRIQNADRGGV